ncbi:MAG TPA: AgmX/PglI C-terminal domain-containing protein [Anaeromyxobacter sp.]|nr:AgmX/PglI C-terminal domain-containing protein [Anaeromyxobacter sp.]
MAPAPDETLDDAALDGGEWLFRRSGDVFGPVDSRTLAAMLYRGELEPGTPISAGDGRWAPVEEEPLFRLHARKAEAALRVEREVTGSRMLALRRRRRRTVAWIAGASLMAAGAVGGAFLLARQGARTSPLLEDFGAGIRLASAARVGVSRRAAGDEEVEIPIDREAAQAAPSSRRERARPAPAGQVAGGELVEARYDAARIQAVVAREQRSLAPCLREEAARSPELRGDVPIEFAIGNDGRVATLWIDDPRLRGGPLEACLTRALAAWRFDPFPGERPTVSLAFRIAR